MNGPIDIVIPWVNGNDPEWFRQKEEDFKRLRPDLETDSQVRYQTWDNLHYWFRAIEKFMPWVNRIFLVTWGHFPEFLKAEHPKLRLVKHSDYIPEKYLPNYNSNPIEMNYHRIEDLSENFIIFNDDFFPLQPIKETYYFRNDVVCDEAVESPIIPISKNEGYDGYRCFCGIQLNNLSIINRHFKKRDVQKQFWKWFWPGYGQLLKRNIGLHYWYKFVGFRDPHMASAMKKSTLAHLWEVEPEALDIASQNRFRNGDTDISQYLIRYWQLCSGEFYPRRTKGKYNDVSLNNYKQIAEGIRKQKWQMVVLNENCTGADFEVVKAEINAALEAILPEKSSFEK